ncbi:MAG: lytic transglycosylase domain-containing protein [Rickettsiales bacterium]|nr:lytic transglycosylase domain-containing protein [Rickettsiales bacterium]
MDLAKERDWEAALKVSDNADLPLLSDMILWMRYISEPAEDFNEITRFISVRPDWPWQKSLAINAERSLTSQTQPEDMLAWFRDDTASSEIPVFREPLTSRGKYFLATTLMNTPSLQKTHEKQIHTLMNAVWRDGNLSDEEEADFLNIYSKYLHKEDHVARIDRLIWEDKLTEAKRLLPKIDKEHRSLFEARIALKQETNGVDSKVNKVLGKFRNDPGLLYDRIRWRNKRNMHEGVRELLLRVPENISYADKFWDYRHRHIRALLAEKDYKTAYTLASKHGLYSGADFAAGEWLSGWIALRFLDKPQEAYQHFFKLYHAVETPISLARASYWAGRAAEANRNTQIALKWYVIASKYPTTYYGQLGTEKTSNNQLYIPALPRIGRQDKKRFENNALAAGAYLLHTLNMDRYAREFIKAAMHYAKTPGEKRLVAELGLSINRPDLSLNAAKVAAQEGYIYPHAYYPAISYIKQGIGNVSGAPEKALVHAISMQESMFNYSAISHAGARGMMQLMPGTARMTARNAGIRYTPSRLTADPVYNVTLGTHHLKELLGNYRGSYILSIAAYNAGGGNVAKWLKQNGDPREMKDVDDVIDWVESIPFNETRNYVQRVMENIQLFRYSLKEYKSPYVALARDLLRR